jgi:hypothetical protein
VYPRSTVLQASAYIGADSSLDAASDPAASVVLLPGDNSGSSSAGGAASAAAAAAAAVKSGAAESPVLPTVPFEACLNKFTAAEVRPAGAGLEIVLYVIFNYAG